MLALSLIAVTVQPAQPGPSAVQYAQTIPAGLDDGTLMLTGTKLGNLASVTRSGLRVRLPSGQPSIPPVGIITIFRIEGDFEIEGGYQMLSKDRPESGSGAGISLYLEFADRDRSAFTVARYLHPTNGDCFVTHRSVTTGGKRTYDTNTAHATATYGRLRLTRSGTTLSFSVADGRQGYREIRSEDVGPWPVQLVRVAVENGRGKTAVDAILTDFRARASAFPTEPLVAPSDSIRWWLVPLALGMAVIAVLAWRWRSRHRARAEEGTSIETILGDRATPGKKELR